MTFGIEVQLREAMIGAVNPLSVASSSEARLEGPSAPAVTPDQRLSATACLGMAQAVSGQAQAAAATLDEAGPLLDAPGVSPIGRLEAQMRLAEIERILGEDL